MSELLASPASVGLIVLRTLVVYTFILLGRIASKNRRENGCPTVADCKLAVMEVDGTISAIADPGPPGRMRRNW